MRFELAKEKKGREEVEEKQQKEITDNLARLSEGLDQERSAREEKAEKIVRKLAEEIAHMKDQIATEKKVGSYASSVAGT